MCLDTVDAETLSVDRFYKCVNREAAFPGEYCSPFYPACLSLGKTWREEWCQEIPSRDGGSYVSGSHGYVRKEDAEQARGYCYGNVMLECAVSDIVASGTQKVRDDFGESWSAPCVVARIVTPLREVHDDIVNPLRETGEDDAGSGRPGGEAQDT